MIAAIVPADTVTTHTLFCLKESLPLPQQQYLCGMFNSFVANYLVRLRINTHVSAAVIDRLPIPRPRAGDPRPREIARLAATLACGHELVSFARLQAIAADLYGLHRRPVRACARDLPVGATRGSRRLPGGLLRYIRRSAAQRMKLVRQIRPLSDITSMPNYGFAIDLRKCIGCHACTIACKAEHQIPVGVNRCWVKTVEKGTFPDTRRFFFPVLCNQCVEAPCVRICPTNALFKRRDGIVDLNSQSCIGCRACMEACPYDQLFIDPNTRTAEKCNFCANRVENRLEPACVSVCPTECRIFGDLDDPASEVARIVRMEAFTVRKPEKGTGPKVFYIAAEDSAIRPESGRSPPYI